MLDIICMDRVLWLITIPTVVFYYTDQLNEWRVANPPPFKIGDNKIDNNPDTDQKKR